jgi:hypothetical protein
VKGHVELPVTRLIFGSWLDILSFRISKTQISSYLQQAAAFVSLLIHMQIFKLGIVL